MNLWSRTLGQTASPSYTFRPLSRRRYRCVQTGDIVKQAQLGSYSRNKVNGGRRRASAPRAPDWPSPQRSAAPYGGYGSSSYGSYW